MTTGKVYIVVVQDLVVQSREYVVVGISRENAVDLVKNGHFIVESGPSTMDTVKTQIVSVEELDPTEFGLDGSKAIGENPPMGQRPSDLIEEILDDDLNTFSRSKALRKLIFDLRRQGS